MRMKYLALTNCFAGSTFLALCVLLTGCGMSGSGNSGALAPGSPKVNLGLTGAVHGGQNPILGSTIQLYEVGTTGYSSLAKPLITSTTVTTNSGGGFSITGDYSCTTGTYLYITAAGGSPQLSANPTTNNNNITLGAALGLCDNLSASTFIIINEETTVALAYALAQFSAGTKFGTTLLSQPGSGSSAPADNFASSGTNTIGLANAMATAQVLTNVATGTSPGSNSNGSAAAEWWQVNMIADILGACVNSTGGSAGDSTVCGTLFADVTPSGGAAPADTLQAALDLALAPTLSSANTTALFNLIPPTAPFQPYPSSASSVYDFSVAVSYTPVSGSTKLLSQPQAVSIDSLGNAWVGNQPTSSPYHAFLVELTPTGVPIQAGSASGNYTIGTYTASGTSTAYSPSQYSGTVAEGLFAPSIDTNNNVWITDRANSYIAEITGSGTAFSSNYSYQNGGTGNATGYALNSSSLPTSVYVDGSNNVWFDMEGSNTASSCAYLGSGTSITGYSTAYNEGVAAFLGGSSTNVVVGKTANAVGTGEPGYITVDPGKNNTVSVSGSPTTISGSPFVWVIGNNGQVNLILPYSSQTTSTSLTPTNGVPYAGCLLNTQAIGQADDTAASDTYFNNPANTNFYDTGDTGVTAHAQSWVPDIPNPGASGDFFHNIGFAQDWTWDNAGNLWVTNGAKNYSISTTTYQETIDTAGTINYAISKITPAWGSANATTNNGVTYDVPPADSSSSTGVPATNPPSNFTYSIFHAQSGLFDSAAQTGNPSMYITTDGSGNVYFTAYKNYYLNAFSNSGTALTQVSGTATNPVTGFVGSICASCSYNGTTATYQRPNSYTLSRPTIDQAGNIWVPLQGSGSTSLYLLVGAAAPRVGPDSVGLKNGTFAEKP